MKTSQYTLLTTSIQLDGCTYWIYAKSEDFQLIVSLKPLLLKVRMLWLYNPLVNSSHMCTYWVYM